MGAVEREEGGSLAGEPLSTTLTPSGIEIEYYVEPRRMYRIRETWPGHEEQRQFDGWEEVPSVTSVFGKPELAWWGMRVGIEGIETLHADGLLKSAKLKDGRVVFSYEGYAVNAKGLERLLMEYELDTNKVRDRAGDRGQVAHDALEEWAKTGDLPHITDYEEAEQGYVRGLRLFLAALQEAGPEDIKTEVMVGSIEHGYAGRYDLELRTTKPVSVVDRWYPKREPRRADLPTGYYLLDLKTTKYVYETHAEQLEGYELARRECGYEPTDARAVIHVGPGDPTDNKVPDVPHYEVVKSWATGDDFLGVLGEYYRRKAMAERKKETKWQS